MRVNAECRGRGGCGAGGEDGGGMDDVSQHRGANGRRAGCLLTYKTLKAQVKTTASVSVHKTVQY